MMHSKMNRAISTALAERVNFRDSEYSQFYGVKVGGGSKETMGVNLKLQRRTHGLFVT